jgi:ceramide glucosyltransferase
MMPEARHDILVMSDSDIAVPAGWLAQVVAALEAPGIGAVTCLYTGQGRGVWGQLSAMGTNYEFLPNVILGASLGLADPCMGSTIALRRETLDQVGSFAAFADFLADDYEIGRAVRAQGLGLAIPALAVVHSAAERSFGDVFDHDLRWTRTIRTVNPAGHLGSIVTHGFPLAFIAACLLGFSSAALTVLAVALAARLFLKYRMDRIFGVRAGSPWLLPVRDVLSFAVFVTSLFGETIRWRGSRFSVTPDGAMSRS